MTDPTAPNSTNLLPREPSTRASEPEPAVVAAYPVVLGRNTPPTFYRGSGRIGLFRGMPADDEDLPEDWVASTVTRLGEATSGMTVLKTGAFLRDEVRADPTHWLGSEQHPSPELRVPLVKLLDAGQRLPVHAHPSDFCARDLRVWPNGKAEAWFIVDAPAAGVVHLGWTRDISAAELVGWVDNQDTTAMLAAMHVVNVEAGDSIYVPPGTVHAIGEGIFLVEVQQAADLSILLEWKDFFADESGAFLGLDRAAALGCVDLQGLATAEVEALIEHAALNQPVGRPLLPESAAAYFSAVLLGTGSVLPRGYCTLVVLTGSGTLEASAPAQPTTTQVAAGTTLAVPAAAGPLVLLGTNELRVLAFGPGHGEA